MQLQNLPSSLGALQPGIPASTPTSDSHDIWAKEHLQDFAERMAMHGMAVSCVRLRNDSAYTLRQLATAHATDDETLREMAMTLFRQFERNRSGIPSQFSD
jgi:hypothetical protein